MILPHGSALTVLLGIAACTRIALGQGDDLGSVAANGPGLAILSYNLDVASPLHVVDCLAPPRAKQDKQIRIIPAQQAKNALFPWLEESVLSLEPKQAAMLLSDDLIREKARKTGLRYLVFLTQASGSSSMNGPFACGGGYGGAGCLGGARIARETTIAAVIWDLERGRESRELSDTKRAHDILVGLVLPLWIPGGLSTRMQACHTMAQKILQIVGNADAVPEGPASEAMDASAWRSSAEIIDAENGTESGTQAASCFDSFAEQTTDAPPRDDAPSSGSAANDGSNVQITDGIQWNDGVSSVQDMVARPPAVARFGSIAVSNQFFDFVPSPSSQPEQRLRIPFSGLKTVAVERSATTLVLLQTKADCRAAFQVPDASASVVRQRTEDLGKLLAQRLADYQEHADPAAR
jgi:hypothetical protein